MSEQGQQRTIVPLKDFHENADIELLEWKKWRERAEKAEAEVERLREREEDCWKTAFTSGWEQANNYTDWIEYEQWKAKAEGGEG